MVQYRSETMARGTLIIPADRAHEFIDVIGRKTNLHLVDMNEATGARQYKNYIQRIDEMERILRFLFEVIGNLPGAVIQKNQIDSFLDNDSVYAFDQVETSLQKLYEQFAKFRQNNSDLCEQRDAAAEEKAVATAAMRSLMPDVSRANEASRSDATRQGLLSADVELQDPEIVGFSTIAGVIGQTDQERFARTVHRATRGNAFTHFESVQEPHVDSSGSTTSFIRNVFVIYFQGSMNSAMAERIFRICAAFGVKNYPWPKNYVDADKRVGELQETIVERTRALQAYEEYQIRETAVLLDVVGPYRNSLIEEWRLFCIKEKAIFATLNLFEGSDVTLRADCWYPIRDQAVIRDVLMSQSNTQQVSAFILTDIGPLPKSVEPPTYFRCPEFTLGFQNFVDTYGTPRYKEANPALTTIVTLPFLFGIMYGDVGHGTVVFLAGLYMVLYWHSKLKYQDVEVLKILGGGRYMIMLMGMCAIYCGFMYNDFFALGMDIFGTRYKELPNDGSSSKVLVRDTSKNVYPFGFDPAWKGATNEIDFFNSFKMKFSVIMGLVQMGLGVLHKASNALHFKDYLGFWFEFVPQMTFLVCLVGWMDFLIMYKWMTDATYPKPSIISTTINMFFFKTEDPFFPWQGKFQMFLVTVMLICIPLMLLVKPFTLKHRHAEKVKQSQAASYQPYTETTALKTDFISPSPPGVVRSTSSHPETPGHYAGHEEEIEEFDFGEEIVHQLIHTIEFVLGTVSNTASYLRLWALSLAHQQLSLVFFENIMLSVLKQKMNVIVHSIMIFVAFAIFAAVTFGIMICMDSLECFLHALRLQWVEFQNKFYHGDGYKFEPLNFNKCLTEEEN